MNQKKWTKEISSHKYKTEFSMINIKSKIEKLFLNEMDKRRKKEEVNKTLLRSQSPQNYFTI